MTYRKGDKPGREAKGENPPPDGANDDARNQGSHARIRGNENYDPMEYGAREWDRAGGINGHRSDGTDQGGEQPGAARSERNAGASCKGTFAGVGPKGWQRSDERIWEEICESMADHPDIDAAEVEIQVAGGVVTLSGTVRDRGMKRIAEYLAERGRGVRDVINNLRIAATSPDPEREA